MDDVETVFPPFEVTRAAIDQIEALGGAVRIDLEEGGCCGLTYTYAKLPDGFTLEAEDQQYGCPGAWLIVGARVAELLPGAKLDYSDRLKPPRFRVIGNPNTPHVCACRRSFGQPWPGPRQPTCRSYLPMPWDDTYDPPHQWKRQTGYEG